MKYLVNSIIILIISMSLLACNDKEKAVPQAQEEVYDFRNEKYQDFYSRFMREVERRNLNAITPNDSFERPFTKEYINDVLGLDVKDDLLFKVVIYRVEPQYNKEYNQDNHFKDKNDILDLYRKIDTNKLLEYQECADEFQVNGLFCLDKINQNKREYYYFPTNSQKIPYVNQSIKFFCENINSAHGKYINCKLLNLPDNPYNLNIWISFDNPNDFFHIIEYVEKYIHNATGEHIWQTSLNQKSH